MTSAVAPRIGTPNGTTRLQASTALCPQLARADISLKKAVSRFDVVDGARSRRRIAQPHQGAVHMQITTIGLEIAKNVFQVHGFDAAEKVIVR